MILRPLLMLGLVAASIVPSAHAAPLFYRVDLNFASAPLGNGPYSLDLQLNGTLNNTVTAMGFTFNAGGGFTGTPTIFGLVTGSPQAGGFTLADNASSFANEIYITLSPATTMLSFFVTQSDNAPAGGGIPDAFSVALLDSSLANITTTGIGDSLILANIIGGANALSGVSASNGSGAYSGVAAAAVPEPSAMVVGVLWLGLAVAGLRLRLRRLRSVPAAA